MRSKSTLEAGPGQKFPQHIGGGILPSSNNTSNMRRKSYTGTIELGKSPGAKNAGHHSKFS